MPNNGQNQNRTPGIAERFENATGIDLPDIRIPDIELPELPTPREILDGLGEAFERTVDAVVPESVQNFFRVNIAEPLGFGENGSFRTARRDPTGSGAVRPHKGIDVSAPTGTPVSAAAPGRVIMRRTYPESSEFGNMLMLDHYDGNVVTLYAHASRLNVGLGEEVNAGQTIMQVGSTGRSTGPHLHFECWVRGEDGRLYSVDPRLAVECDNLADVQDREQLIQQTLDNHPGLRRSQLLSPMDRRVETAINNTGTFTPAPQAPEAQVATSTTPSTEQSGQRVFLNAEYN